MFWVVGGPTVGLEGVRGSGHAPARAGGGPGTAGGLVGVDPAVDPWCAQRVGQLPPREAEGRLNKWFAFPLCLPLPAPRCMNHGSLSYSLN